VGQLAGTVGGGQGEVEVVGDAADAVFYGNACHDVFLYVMSKWDKCFQVACGQPGLPEK